MEVDCLKFFKVNKGAKTWTNTSYRLHIYIEIPNILLVFTVKREYKKILNSSNFIRTKLKGIKSCINRVETANTGVGLQICWLVMLVSLFGKTVLIGSQRICKLEFMTKLCSHYPMFNPDIARLRVDNSKSVIVKSWNKVRGK